MKLSHEILTLRTTHPFTIARGGSSEFPVVWVRVTDSDGNDGWGEASPSKFYGETADTVVAVLPRLAAAIEGMNPWSLEEIERQLDLAIRFNGSAKSAISAQPTSKASPPSKSLLLARLRARLAAKTPPTE